MSARRSLTFRFLAAQLLVVAASLSAAVVVAWVAGPPIFHEHLVMAGHREGSAELLHAEQAYRDTTLLVLGVALGSAVVCALAVSAFCARRIRRSLGQLTAAARSMASGRYDTRVPELAGGPEVGTLTGAFNTMASRLEGTEATRQRMLSDLAHELRTPVSVLSVYLDALQDGVASWDGPTKELMAGQLGRLERLVEDIHDVSRAQEARIVLERDDHPVEALLQEAAEAHSEAFATKDVTLSLEIEARTGTVEVDRQRIGQVLANLLSNALRHTPSDGHVTLRAVTSGEDHLTLLVSDTGEGIDAEHLPHLFERFYRADAARDRDHGGSGIGLAISRALVEAHGGTLRATSEGPGQGATFVVELPRRSRQGWTVPADD
ncbi:sensor histidine kinase [Nesterenkonia halobia]|uniref:histidine kinase n=1 Tax=Nesterenkonia halobia TaxID=37922 RepID=A0ABP6RD22_9MICC